MQQCCLFCGMHVFIQIEFEIQLQNVLLLLNWGLKKKAYTLYSFSGDFVSDHCILQNSFFFFFY